MVGGIIIGVNAFSEEKTKLTVQGTGESERFSLVSVHAEPGHDFRCGDIIWWQAGNIYWTRAGEFCDKAVPKIGSAFDHMNVLVKRPREIVWGDGDTVEALLGDPKRVEEIVAFLEAEVIGKNLKESVFTIAARPDLTDSEYTACILSVTLLAESRPGGPLPCRFNPKHSLN